MRLFNSQISGITVISRTGLGLVFILAAGSKGMDIVAFGRRIEMVLGKFGSTSATDWIFISLAIGCILLLIEFILGAMLITGYRSRRAAMASAGLLFIFAVILIWEIAAGKERECGCFGALVDRTAGQALLEDMIFLAAAVLALRCKTDKSQVKKRWALLLVGSAVCWVLFFSLSRPAFAALRTGSAWNPPGAGGETIEREDLLVWIFDPECGDCLDQVGYLDSLSGSEELPELIGLTDASPGRLREFIWDFEPEFEVRRIDTDTYRRIFLPAGSLFLVVKGRVKRIWRTGMMPESASVIAWESVQ